MSALPVLEERLLTAEEAGRLSIQGRWELVDGEVITCMPVQPEHGDVAIELGYHIRAFLGSPERALLGAEIGFTVRRNPDTVRAPDLSLTWRDEAAARRRGAWIEGGPNLAVEVISPDELWSTVQAKVDEYLDAGTQLVWVIDPQSRTVHVYRPDGPINVLRSDATLTGDPVLPGFSLPVASLFPAKPAVENQPV